MILLLDGWVAVTILLLFGWLAVMILLVGGSLVFEGFVFGWIWGLGKVADEVYALFDWD